jgi:hypothetical protein
MGRMHVDDNEVSACVGCKLGLPLSGPVLTGLWWRRELRTCFLACMMGVGSWRRFLEADADSIEVQHLMSVQCLLHAGTSCGWAQQRGMRSSSSGSSSSMRRGTALQTWTSTSGGGCASAQRLVLPRQHTPRRRLAAGRAAAHPTDCAMVRTDFLTTCVESAASGQACCAALRAPLQAILLDVAPAPELACCGLLSSRQAGRHGRL